LAAIIEKIPPSREYWRDHYKLWFLTHTTIHFVEWSYFRVKREK
jgi:hypothetical protein